MAKEVKFFDSSRIANKAKEKIKESKTKLMRNKIEEIKEFMPELNDVQASSIANFQIDKYLKTIEEIKNSKVFLSSAPKKGFGEVDEIMNRGSIAAYTKLQEKNFFKDVINAFGTEKVQKGAQLYDRVIRFDKTNPIHLNKSNGRMNAGSWTNSYNALNKFENIKKNGGHLVTFDTETVPGMDSLGHNSLDYITEMSATVHKIENGKMTVAKRIDSVLGFDDEQYNKALERLKKIEKQGGPIKGTNDEVFFNRMNIYSTAVTEQDGFEVHIKKASGIEDINTSIDKAREGIENLRKIGKQQEAWGVENVGKNFKLKNANKQYVKEVSELISTGKYKGKAYDNVVSFGQNSSMFDIPHMETVSGIKIDTTNHIDLYQLNMKIQDELGAAALLPKGVKGTKQFGRATQENLSTALGYKVSGEAAHIAVTDEEELARMFVQPMNADPSLIENEFKYGRYNVSENSYFEFLKKQADKVNEIISPTNSVYTGKDQVFYMDHTQQKSWADKKGSLSFTVDPTNNQIKTFDGYLVDGNVKHGGFNQYGSKKGSLVTHEVVKIDNKADFKNMFKDLKGLSDEEVDSIFKEVMNAPELYLVKTQDYLDEKILKKKLGKDGAEFFKKNLKTTYTIETNKERLAASLGIQVGDTKGGIKEEAIKSLGLNKVENVDGKIAVNEVPIEEAFNVLKEKSIDRTISDSAERKLRDLKYSQIQKMVAFEKNHATKAVKNPMATHALQYAEAITKGELDLTIQNELGFLDFRTGEMKIYPETIRNSVAAEPFIKELVDKKGTKTSLFDDIEAILDEKYGKFDFEHYVPKDPKQKELYLKREMGFKQILDEYIARANKYQSQGLLTTKDDLNKIEFNTHELFPKQYLSTIASIENETADSVVSLNLNKPNSLLDLFFKDRFGDVADRVNKEGSAGWQSLKDAYRAIRNDSRFGKELWSDINIDKMMKEGYSVTQANDLMMDSLKSFVDNKRSSEKAFGLLSVRNANDKTNKASLDAMKSIKKRERVAILEDIATNLRDSGDILLSNDEKSVDALVKDYFMGYSEEEFKESLKGYTKHQKEILTLQHKLNKNTAKSYAEDLLNAVGQDSELALRVTKTKNGAPILSLINGNKSTVLNAQRFTLNKGISTSSIGGNEYINRLSLVAFNPKGVDAYPLLTTTAERARQLKSLDQRVRWAKSRNGDIGETIIKAVKERSKEVAEATSRVEMSNGQLFTQAFEIDNNGILEMLPIFKKRGILDKVEDKLNLHKKSKTSIDVIRDLTDRIESGNLKLSTKAYKDILPRELNHFMAYYPALIEELKSELTIHGVGKGEEAKYSNLVLNAMRQKSKTTALRTGKDSLDLTYYMDAFAEIDDTNRPPMTQMPNTVLYNKKEIEKGIEDLGTIKAKKAPVVSNSLAERFLYSNVAKDGNVSTSGLTLKFLQIDSYNLQNSFIKDKENYIAKNDSRMATFLKGKGFKDDAARTLFDRATSLSTYEQQALINARVSDVAYHKINTQKINSTKEMIFDMNKDLETIANVKNISKLQYEIVDGKIIYNTGIAVKSGQTLGRFGNQDFSSPVLARYDGIFRGRFFDEHNNVVDSARINKLIAGKDAKTAEEILNKNFTYKYEVMPVKEMHGMKVFLGASEKATTDSLKMTVGSLDKNLATDLKKYGLENLVGSVTYRDYLFGEVKDILSRDAEGKKIFERILNERYALSDYMQLDEKFKGFGIYSAVNTNKHNSASMLMHSFTNNLQDAGLINEENMSDIFGKGNFKIIDDNRVILNPEIQSINLNFKNKEVEEVYNKTVKEFSRGSGYVTVSHGQDDIAGTFSGAKTEAINEKLNEINRKISEASKVSKAERLAKKEKLLKEKEFLQSIIHDVDTKVKTQKDNMKEEISTTLNILEKHFKINNDYIGNLKDYRNVLYAEREGLNKEIKEYKERKKEFFNHDEFTDLVDKQNHIKQELSGVKDELNRRFEYADILKGDLKREREIAFNTKYKGTEDVDIRLKYFDRIDEINKEIKEINKGRGNSKELLDLKKQKLELESAMNEMNGFKGVKFSNAMGANLDRTTFNDDLFKKLKNELDPETFRKYYGYAINEAGNVKDEFKGKSIASPITSRLRGQLVNPEGSLTVADAMEDSRLKEQYGYLYDNIVKNGGDASKVSVKKAENMYSVIQGTRAMQFNESPKDRVIRERLFNNKLDSFKEIGFRDLELEIGGQGRTVTKSANNPYTNNLLIKTGLSGNYSELAIARMPEVHAGDRLIQKSHIMGLSSLKEMLEQYHNETDEKTKEWYRISAEKMIDNIKALQKKDITSKTGLLREGQEYRMNDSFFGKASGININSYNGNEDLFGALKKGSNTRLSRDEIINKLEVNNGKYVGRMFGGKSLLEHYAEGNMIDHAFVSENLFERLGYFNENKMKEVFDNINGSYLDKVKNFDLSTNEGRRGAMKHLLSTEGDSFLTVRYPEIMEGSDKFAQVYLDDSLKDNEIRVAGASGMSAKLDHDGDQFAAALMKNANGQSKLISEMTGAVDDGFFKSFDASIMTRAATNNVYWENKVKDHIRKEATFSSNVDNIKKIAGKRVIDGKVYTSNVANYKSYEELDKLKTKYLDLLKMDKGTFKDMSKEEEQEFIGKIVKTSGYEDKDKALNEYMTAWAYSDNQDMITAKIYQNAVGETNVTNQKVKSVVSGLIDKNDEAYEYKQNILGDFLYRAEEGAISSKSSVEGLEPDRAKNWNDSVLNVIQGKDVENNQKIMKEWLQDNVQKEAFIESYYARSSHFSDYINDNYNINNFGEFKNLLKNEDAKKEIMNKVTDDVVDTISEVGKENRKDIQSLLNTLRIGVSQTGVNSRTVMNPMFIKDQETNAKTYFSAMKEIFGDNSDFKEMESRLERRKANEEFRQGVHDIVSNVEAPAREGVEETIENIGEGLKGLAKSAKGKKIAMGAVGVAAGVMIAGFVGGRPRPAETQAMEEAQDYQEQPQMGLADPSMISRGPQQGYVVNINARTDKGREHAIQALQQAIQNGTSSNINISMNIKDNYGNINDRDIEEAIMGAFN